MKKIIFAILGIALILTAFSLVASEHKHEWGEWITVKNATCTTDGTLERACECGQVETQTIVAPGHTESDWITVREATCTTDGSKHQICSVCNDTVKTETITKLGHTEGEWIIDAEATCTENGSKHQICSVCEETINTDTISAIRHNFTETVIPSTGESPALLTLDCTVCGHSETNEIAPISVYAELTNSGVEINYSGRWYYRSFEVTASGGYGEYLYQFETGNTVFQSFSSSNSSTVYGNMFSVGDGMSVKITVMDEIGQQTVYIIQGNGAYIDSYVVTD